MCQRDVICSYVLRCALARRPSINLRFLCAQMRSRSTPVSPNALRICSNALSLDARLSKCVSYVLRFALAQRPSIKMRFRCAQMRSRSTPAYLNAFPMCSDALSHDACLSKCVSYVLRCALARRPSIQICFQCAQMCSRLSVKFSEG